MIGNPIIISGGTKLPELTTPGTAADLLSPKQLIDADGNVLTGTMPEVERATPAISVSSAGLITASVSQQTAGYMAGGTTSATKQLTTKAAATITPGTTDQTIAAGTYLTGAQTIKGDSNLLATNIKSGASIFGVAGTYGGAEPVLEDVSVYGTTTAGLVTATVKQTVKSVYSITMRVFLYSGSSYINKIFVLGGDGGFQVYEYGISSSTGESCIEKIMQLSGENLISISDKNITIGEQSLYWQAYVPVGSYISCTIGYVPA